MFLTSVHVQHDCLNQLNLLICNLQLIKNNQINSNNSPKATHNRQMPKSSHSLAKHHQNYNQKDSSEQYSLPSEYEALNKRIQFIETNLVKFQRKIKKIQSIKINQGEMQQNIKTQVLKEISYNQSQNQKDGPLQDIQYNIQQMKIQIKKIEKKNSQLNKEILTLKEIHQTFQYSHDIEDKLEDHFNKNKSYIDQAVYQLKCLLKTYVKEQVIAAQILQTPTHQLSNFHSKSKVTTKSQKSFKKYQDIQGLQEEEDLVSHKNKGKDNQIVHSPSNNNSSSRVSYLRQKLKEFEQINKKYENKIDINPRYESKADVNTYSREEVKAVEKMKNFKDYLQQSESEVEASIMENSQSNILTDSITKWRSAEKIYPSMERKK